ncbi:MAG: hypothetical protein AAGC55_08770 [Myxococcota bacterium]
MALIVELHGRGGITPAHHRVDLDPPCGRVVGIAAQRLIGRLLRIAIGAAIEQSLGAADFGRRAAASDQQGGYQRAYSGRPQRGERGQAARRGYVFRSASRDSP